MGRTRSTSIRYFWSATHQQIYRELGRLEEAGLIRERPQPPSPGQRREYKVLPAGSAVLAEWVVVPEDPRPLRDALALRLRAAAVVGAEGLAEEFARHRALHQAALEEYRAIEARDFPPGQDGRKDRLQHLVLSGGIDLEVSWIAWVDEVIAELSAPQGPADPPGT